MAAVAVEAPVKQDILNGNSGPDFSPTTEKVLSAEMGSDLESDLADNITLVKGAVSAFFENRFDDALAICETRVDTSMYHSFGKSIMKYINATMTLERNDIEAGVECLKHSLELCSKARRSKGLVEGMTDWFRTPNYDDYTDEECHAELVFAEMQSLVAVLSFLQDSSIINLVKNALRMRASHLAHTECFRILKKKTVWSSKICFNEFRAGTASGNGLINLALSYLPARVLKVVEFVGYSGDRELALKLMRQASENRTTLRFPLISAIICAYNLYIEHMGLGAGDVELAESILDELREKFPSSAFLVIYYAKLKQLRGETEGAIVLYNKTIEMNKSWKQLHVFCYWELSWSYAVIHNWDEAQKFAKIMVEKSVYGKAIYQHIYASFLHMQMVEEDRPDLKDKVVEAMSAVSDLRKRYAGKTVPPEKFAVSKAEQYLESDGESDPVPAYSLFYFYNMFALTGKLPEKIAPMMALMDKTLAKVDKTRSVDTFAFVQLIRGVLFRMLNENSKAIECFRDVIEIEKEIVQDTYIAPLACLELGVSHMNSGNLDEAKHWLERGRTDYSKYLCEAYVHIRLHGALQTVKLLSNKNKSHSSKESLASKAST